MTNVDKLVSEINKAIDNGRDNLNVSYAEVIGALEMIKYDILAEASETVATCLCACPECDDEKTAVSGTLCEMCRKQTYQPCDIGEY